MTAKEWHSNLLDMPGLEHPDKLAEVNQDTIQSILDDGRRQGKVIGREEGMLELIRFLETDLNDCNDYDVLLDLCRRHAVKLFPKEP